MSGTARDAWLMPGMAAALAVGILVGRAADGVILCAVALACAVAAALLLRGSRRRAAVMAVAMALGSVLGYGAYHPCLPEEGDYVVSGVVADEIHLRDDGQVRTTLRSVTLDGQPIGFGAYWTYYLAEDEEPSEELMPGRRVTVTARVYHPGGADNPGGYNFREALLQKGIGIGVYGDDALTLSDAPGNAWGIAATLRHRLSLRLMDVMGAEAGSYAAAMLLGNRELVPSEDREAFSKLGVAHILSVSGFHVGVLAGLIGALLKRLHLSRKARLAVTAVILSAYCLLTGMNVPVVRASLLMMLWEYGAIRHRQRINVYLLAACFVIILLLSPVQITSVSFHLTFGAMLGLSLVTPAMERLHTFQHSAARRAWRSLCGAVGAQIGVLAPTVYWFQELPLLGLVLNVTVFALASIMMTVCWLTLFLLPAAPLAALTGSAAGGMITAMLAAVRRLGGMEGITLWTCQGNLATLLCWGLLLAALSMWWRWHGWRRATALSVSVALLMASLIPWPHTTTEYIQFSVGEADAALLWDEEKALAIDAGEDDKVLATYLRQHRLSLDALILTHLHADHAGGLRALLDDGIPIARCYVPWGAEDAAIHPDMTALLDEAERAGTEIIHLARGDRIALPHGSITVLWPEKGKVRPAQEANQSSLVMLAEMKGTTLLLTGDMDGLYEDYAAVPADILKVAHHGSTSSTSAEFLQATSPKLLLLSCGNKARRQSMEERRQGIDLVDTDAHGAVTIHLEEDGWAVETVR